VGIADLIKIGEPVQPGTLLCTLHVNDDAKGAKAEALVREAMAFSADVPAQDALIQDLVQ
jgi:thymidine phosphorylase